MVSLNLNMYKFVILVDKLKKYTTNKGVLGDVEEDIGSLFEKLIDSEFFKDISKALITTIVKGREDKFDDFENQMVIGIMLGLSLGRYDIVQYNIKKLTRRTYFYNISGLTALITKDPSEEKSLKLLFKTLQVPSKLAINLLKLVNFDQKHSKYVAALNICKTHCSNPALVASLVALMKNDISNVMVIKEALNLNDSKSSTMFTILSALTNKDFSKVKDKISYLDSELRIDNEEFLEFVLQISCGNVSEEVLSMTSCYPSKRCGYLLQVFINLLNLGASKRKFRIKINYEHLQNDLNIMSKSLTDMFTRIFEDKYELKV